MYFESVLWGERKPARPVMVTACPRHCIPTKIGHWTFVSVSFVFWGLSYVWQGVHPSRCGEGVFAAAVLPSNTSKGTAFPDVIMVALGVSEAPASLKCC
jgi:hypothetical protein